MMDKALCQSILLTPWMTLDEMCHGCLAPHREECIRVLLDDDVPQAYGISSGKLRVVK